MFLQRKMASPETRPRSKLPKPYVPQPKRNKDDDIAALEDKLKDFKAENQLLGRVLQDAQTERRRLELAAQELEKKNAELQQFLQDERQKRQHVEHNLDHLIKELDQARSDQTELEGLVLELSERCSMRGGTPRSSPCEPPPDPKGTLPPSHQGTILATRASAAVDQASPRAHDSRKPWSPPPGKGRRGQVSMSPPRSRPTSQGGRSTSPSPTRGHRVQGSGASDAPGQRPPSPTRRVGSILNLSHHLDRMEALYHSKLQAIGQQYSQQLAEKEKQYKQQLAAVQQQTQQLLNEIRLAASEQVQQAEQAVQKQVENQMRIIEQLEKRCALLEQRVQEAKTSHTQSKWAAQQLQAENARLKGQLDLFSTQDQDGKKLGVSRDVGAELASVKQELHKLVREKQQIAEAVEATAASGAVYRRQACDALNSMAKMRGELVKTVTELHNALAANAALSNDKLALTEQLAAAEAAIRGMRSNIAEIQEQLLEWRTTGLGELMKRAVEVAQPHSKQGLQPPDLDILPEPAQHYIRLLEYTLSEAEEREASLKHAAVEAQFLEDQGRSLLAAARDEQVASQRALLHQMRRMHALEGLRLADVQELHLLQQQLAETCNRQSP